MKNLILLVFIFLTTSLSAQRYSHVNFNSNVKAPLSTKEMAQLEEVYGPGATFVTEKPSLLRNIKDLLRNRVEVMYIPLEKARGAAKYRDAPDLAMMELYNTYNPNLRNDTAYNENTFNILKYAINHYPTEKEIYKLGDYYITILPQEKTAK